jgi:hypothetical protein
MGKNSNEIKIVVKEDDILNNPNDFKLGVLIRNKFWKKKDKKMKTIRNTKTGELKRLNDKEAEKMVRQGYLGWTYAPKDMWKKETRVKKQSKTETETQENDGPKKGKRVSK